MEEQPFAVNESADPCTEPGVSSGYIVVWPGRPGPGVVASASRLVDADGVEVTVLNEAFRECEVLDDDGESGSG